MWNHTFYFNQFAKDGCDEPRDDLKAAVEAKFGSLEAFKDAFSKAAATLFGSGWAWLVVGANGELEIVQTSNAGNPLTEGKKPLLTCDVWEHAYYLKYQNKRPDYISAFWSVINWNEVNMRFEKALSL